MGLTNAQIRNGTTGPLADLSPLVARITQPRPGCYWEVYSLSAAGVFTANAPLDPFAPGCCLSLANAMTGLETLAQAAVQLNLDSRGQILLSDWAIGAFVAGVGFAFTVAARLSLPLVVTPDQELRFFATINPGTPNPGPGVGSVVQLTAQFAERRI